MSKLTEVSTSSESLGLAIPGIIKPGSHLGPLRLPTVTGEIVEIPDPDGRLTHLQFLRWAGCSICSLALMEYRRNAQALRCTYVREVIVFHSSIDDIHEIHSSLPFDLIADPGKILYRRFAVGASLFFLLSPRTIVNWFKSLAVESDLKMTNGPFGLPANFLIAPDGEVLALKYGKFADDSWQAQEVLELARQFNLSYQNQSTKQKEDRSMMPDTMARAMQEEVNAPDRLTARKILILIALTVPVWFLAAMFIRWRGPHGVFTGTQAMVLYLLTIPCTMPLNWWSRRIVSLPRHELPKVISVTSATAILLDGFAMNRFPALYGSSPAIMAGGAAWLLWAIGIALTLALVSASSSPQR